MIGTERDIIRDVQSLSETYEKEIVQRITRNLLDIQILRLLRNRPMWGYMITKQAEARFYVKLRHGALYPLLNNLEKNSFLTSEQQPKGKRKRKVYKITSKGAQYVETYEKILRAQIGGKDVT
jgi:PadR family transcriptional regulator